MRTVEQVRQALEGTQALDFGTPTTTRAPWLIEAVLRRFEYRLTARAQTARRLLAICSA